MFCLRNIFKNLHTPPTIWRKYNFASFKEKIEQKNLLKQEQEFKNELESLLVKPTFTLVDYKQRILDGLTKLKKGFKAKLMTGTEQSEINLTMQKKILNTFYDDELNDPSKIKSQQKKEAAMISQYDVSEVNQIFKSFKHIQGMHKWLQTIKQRGESIPKTQDELVYRYRKEQKIDYMDSRTLRKRMHISKRQYTQKMKWGARKRV